MKFTDFFKPAWKHSDPKIRTEAIKELDAEYHLEDLILIAISDELFDNRKIAIKKINDETSLSRIINESQDKALISLAQRKLNDLWAIQIKKSPDYREIKEILNNINDQKSLEDIALSHTLSEVRRDCVSRITNTNAFYKIALKEQEDDIALSVLDKVSKPSHVESLSKKAKSKAVRQKAKDRIQSHRAPSDMPSKEQVASAKFDLLIGTLQGLKISLNWEKSLHTVKDAEETWRSLVHSGNTPSASSEEEFKSLTQKFWTQYEAHKNSEEQKKQEQQRLQNNSFQKRTICDQLDELMSKPNTQDRNQAVSDLIQQWASIGDAPEEEEQSLKLRFDRLTKPFYGQKDELERMLAFEKTIESVVSEARALIASEEVKADLPALWSDVQKKWSHLNVPETHPQFAKFQELIPNVEESLQAKAASQAQENQTTLERLSEIIPQIEALPDRPDIIAAESDFKDFTLRWKELDTLNLLSPEQSSEYDTLKSRYHSATERFREAQEWLRWANLKKKQEICSRLKELSESQEEPKEIFPKMRELQKEWTTIGPVSWDSSKEIWDTYRQLIDDFYERCQDYFEEIKVERQENLVAKEALCKLVEENLETENWRESTETIKEAQQKWKNVGPVPRENSDQLWERFRNACDKYFQSRRDYYEGLNKEKDENLSKKEELCDLVEENQNSTNWKKTGELFKKAQEDWKNIGPVPKEKMSSLWERFRKACDTFFSARDEYFKELAIEKKANHEKKIALCERVEQLAQQENNDEKLNAIKELQAEWKTIGLVEKDKMELLWERFRKPIDEFFQDRKRLYEERQLEREENLKKKEELCLQAEGCSESTDWKSTSELLKSLQSHWKQIGPAPREKDKDVWNRFRSACDDFFSRMKDHYRQLDEQRELNLRIKEDLCFQAERLAGFEVESDSQAPVSENEPEEQPPCSIDWNGAALQIKEFQKKWKQTGPVPKSKSDELWNRFRMACDYVFEWSRKQDPDQAVDFEANFERKSELCESAEIISNQVHTDAQIQKIKDIQREWKSIGPVDARDFAEIWARFKQACDKVFAEDERLRH